MLLLSPCLLIERIDPIMRQSVRAFCVCIVVYFAIVAVHAQTMRIDRMEDQTRTQQHQIDRNTGELGALGFRISAYDAMQVERRITNLEANSEIQIRLLYGISVGVIAGLIDMFKRWSSIPARSKTLVEE